VLCLITPRWERGVHCRERRQSGFVSLQRAKTQPPLAAATFLRRTSPTSSPPRCRLLQALLHHLQRQQPGFHFPSSAAAQQPLRNATITSSAFKLSPPPSSTSTLFPKALKTHPQSWKILLKLRTPFVTLCLDERSGLIGLR